VPSLSITGCPLIVQAGRQVRCAIRPSPQVFGLSPARRGRTRRNYSVGASDPSSAAFLGRPRVSPNLRDPEAPIPTLSCLNALAGEFLLSRKLAHSAGYDQSRREEFALVNWSGHVAGIPVGRSTETAGQRTDRHATATQVRLSRRGTRRRGRPSPHPWGLCRVRSRQWGWTESRCARPLRDPGPAGVATEGPAWPASRSRYPPPRMARAGRTRS